jgi:ubiquinone/menaquinone biosynthesis C-methylase UbiE
MIMNAIDPTIKEYINSEAIASEYDACFANNPLFAMDEEFVFEHVIAGNKVLDIGCGTGRHTLMLEKSACKVFGIDMSNHMIKQTKEKLKKAGITSVRIVNADMLNLPFSNESGFDVALLMFSTFGLVFGKENRLKFLKEIKRVLSTDGRIILHVHNEEYAASPSKNISRKIIDRLGQLTGDMEKGDHLVQNYREGLDIRIHTFSKKEIEELLTSAGFNILRFEGLNDLRDDYYSGNDIEQEANGFLIVAESSSRWPR